jgi:hypothetical protein
MTIKNIITTFLILLSFSACSQETKSEAGGPPERSQLIGFWKKIEMPNEEKVNKVNPWPKKYQWFAFYDNGKVYSMMSDNDSQYSLKELKETFDILPVEKTPNFKLEGQFLTIDNKEIKDYQETWGVNIFAKDINGFLKKGALLMTLDDGKGNVIYYRLLKRME